MVNAFANDYVHLQTIYLALSRAGCAQEEPSLSNLWMASVQLSVTTLRRLFDAAAALESHAKVWQRRLNENRKQTRPKPGASQLEELDAPFQKAEVLKWLQRVVLASLAQVQCVTGDLLLADYFNGSHATHYMLRCAQPEQSKLLVQAACTAINQTCSTICSVLENLQQEVATILVRPTEELAGLNTAAVLAVLLKRKVLGSGFRPVYDDNSTFGSKPEANVDAARKAVAKLQTHLDVHTVAADSTTPGPPGSSQEAGTSQPGASPSPPCHKPVRQESVRSALAQAGRQASRKTLLQVPEVLIPENRKLKNLRRVGLALGCAWLIRNVVRVVRVGLGVTTTVVVPSAAISLPLKIKSLAMKAPIVNPQVLEREKAQLHQMEKEIMQFGRQFREDSKNAGDGAQKLNFGSPPSEIESDDDAELVMMHALHGVSEVVEDNVLSKLSALGNLNPAHLFKVVLFLVKRTKIQAQDMLVQLDNIARTNKLILSILTAAPPLVLSLLIHWCITRRLIWVNARPGSNFLLTLHAQMHVVGNALKAWAAQPQRTDLHGVFLFELAKATRICVKMLNRSRGVCHETLVMLLHEDMVLFSAPSNPTEKVQQFDMLMGTNPLLKDSA